MPARLGSVPLIHMIFPCHAVSACPVVSGPSLRTCPALSGAPRTPSCRASPVMQTLLRARWYGLRHITRCTGCWTNMHGHRAHKCSMTGGDRAVGIEWDRASSILQSFSTYKYSQFPFSTAQSSHITQPTHSSYPMHSSAVLDGQQLIFSF